MRTVYFKKYIIHYLLPLFFSTSIFLYLYHKIDSLDKFLILLKSASYSYILYIIAIFIVIFILRSMRINVFLGGKRHRCMFSICAIHNFINRLFPFGIGELSLPILLKKFRNTGYIHGINMLVLLRLIDIFMIVLIFTGSYFAVKPYFYATDITIALVSILSLLLVIVVKFKLFLHLLIGIMRKLPSELVTNNTKDKMLSKLQSVHTELSVTGNVSVISHVFMYSFCNWVATYVIYLTYLKMFNIEYSIFTTIICSTFALVASNIPFINGIGRFGSFELGWMAGFVIIGNMSRDIAIPMAIFINILNFTICFLFALCSYIYLIAYKKRCSQDA